MPRALRHLLIVAVVLGLSLAPLSVVLHAASYTDAFAGTGALSGNWTAITGLGTPDRTSGIVQGNPTNTVSGAYWSANMVTDDQYAQVKVYADGVGGGSIIAGPACRIASGAQTMYVAYVDSNETPAREIVIYKYVAGTPTKVDDTGVTAAELDVIRIECTGGATSSIQALKNGSAAGSAYADSSSPITSGAVGFVVFTFVGPSSFIDEFDGGDLGGGGGATCPKTFSLLGVGC
jgi:hypothetical protein